MGEFFNMFFSRKIHTRCMYIHIHASISVCGAVLGRCCVRLFVTPWIVAHWLLCPWRFCRQVYGSGLPCPPEGIFPTQGSNPGLLHCRQILYQLRHQGSPRILEWVAYPFCKGSSWPRNWTRVSCIADGSFTSWATRETIHMCVCKYDSNLSRKPLSKKQRECLSFEVFYC